MAPDPTAQCAPARQAPRRILRAGELWLARKPSILEESCETVPNWIEPMRKRARVPSPAPPAEAPRGRIEELNCASCSCPVTLSTSTPASQITPGEWASGFSGRARMHVGRGVWPLVAFNRRHQVKEAIRSIGVVIVGMVVMPHVAADTTATVPTPVGYKRDLHMRGVTTLWTRRACGRLVSGGHLLVHSIAS